MSRLSELCPFHLLLIVIPVRPAFELWEVFDSMKSLFVTMVLWSTFPETPTRSLST